MIKVKVELDSIGRGIVMLWLDGEFQTVYTALSIESCISKAKDIQSVLPIEILEISKEAVEKSSHLNGFSII